jgi:SNF2 family DNA or RNA helicase
MGKTYVTLAYLGGLMRAGSIRNALVVAPLSVLQSWRKEAQKILPQCVSSIRITVLHDMSRAKRLDFIKSLSR